MEVYLVTGGAGFIGANFINYLFSICNDNKVINVDKLTYAGNLENLKAVQNEENYVFLKEDICNEKRMQEIFSQYKPDYVINFAAETHVDRSISSSQEFVRTNVLGTNNLLEASLKADIKKYVQISTDEVYGSLGDEGYFSESTSLQPRNPYAASKAAADFLVEAFFYTYKLPVNITRCTNNYGPYQHEEKFIPLIIKNCLKGKPIPIYGDGSNIRDWINVNDHCRAIFNIIHNGRIGNVYNIGSHSEKTNIELVRFIIKKLQEILPSEDFRRKKINNDLIKFVEDRKGHDWRYALDWRKLDSELGWKPEVGFADGITETIKWYMTKFAEE